MDEPTLYQNLNTLLYSNNSLVILPNTGIDPSQIMSGTQISAVSQNLGNFASGKVSFTDTTEGYILGVNSQGIPEFYIGNATNFLLWDGTNLTVTGSLTADSINIPDNVSANSFHTDSSGNSWWGAVLMASAPAKILNTGAATFSNITVTGGSIAGSTITSASISGSQIQNATISGTNIQNATITGSNGTPAISNSYSESNQSQSINIY